MVSLAGPKDNLLPEATDLDLESVQNNAIDCDTTSKISKPSEVSPIENMDRVVLDSAKKEQSIPTDGKTIDGCDQIESTATNNDSCTATGNSLPTLPYGGENTKELTLITDPTMEKVIGQISYSDWSNKAQHETTLRDIPPNVSGMQPIENSSIVSELPEFSHTPDTTLTNHSSGSSPPQQNTTTNTCRQDQSDSTSVGNSDTSKNKCNHL